MTMSFGLEISKQSRHGAKLSFNHAIINSPGVLKNRSMASIEIEKHNASRKTPLMSAARISALCQP
jgi:hypothetical protein